MTLRVPFLLFLDIGRVGGVAAAGFLHGALDGVFGVFPVGVFELVVEFLLEPFHVAGDPFEVLDHLGEEDFAETGLVFFAQVAFCAGEQVSEMRQAEAFAIFQKIHEFILIPFEELKEGGQIPLVGGFNLFTDVAALILHPDPGADVVCFGLRIGSGFLQAAQKGGLVAGGVVVHLLFEILCKLFQVGFQDQGAAQAVAVEKHFLVMIFAEACFIGLEPDIVLHIGSAGTQGKIDGVLLQGAVDEAERALVLFTEGIHERDGVKLFFHICKPPGEIFLREQAGLSARRRKCNTEVIIAQGRKRGK